MNSFSFRYGRVEIAARLPVGDYLWPALWLLPASNQYGIWPASGEIDIMESTGNNPSEWSSTIHYAPSWPEKTYKLHKQMYQLKSNEGTFHDNFHVFGLVWNEKEIYTYMDVDLPENRVMYADFTKESCFEKGGWDSKFIHNPWFNRPNNAPFDSDFYVILNVAVGGISEFFPDSPCKPWNNTSPHAMNQFWNARNQWLKTWKGEDSALQIDWIAVWSN